MASAIPFFCTLYGDPPAGMWRLILFFALSFSAVARAQSPQDLVQDAMQKQKAGDLEGAVAEYKQFLKLHPEATAIHSNLGAALAGLGRFEEAVPEYKIALKRSPALESARLNLALAYYKMGWIQEAATELEKVHAKDSENRQAALLLGDCYMRMGHEKDVIRVLDPEEQKHPDDLAVAYLLGTALIRDKQVEKGQLLVDRILRRIRQSRSAESESRGSARPLRQGFGAHGRFRSIFNRIQG